MLTRRHALSAVASAALVAPAATLVSHPDADLMRLGTEFETEWARERDLWAAAKRHPWPDPIGIAFGEQAEAQSDRTSELVDRIAAMPAHTLDGVRIKARAYAWCECGEPMDHMLTSEFTDTRVIGSIMRDLLAGVGT